MRGILLIVFMLVTSLVFGTHNRAGEISYKHKGNLTYEITVTTYTDPASTSADRCTLDIDLGDGAIETIFRNNGTKNLCPQFPDSRDGVQINNTTKLNTYVTTHTYAGPGTYVISMLDPNRVAEIENIPNSVSVPFFLKSTLVISPTVGHNNSPVLQNWPIDNGCLKKPYYHNPGAVDPDNDSLVYSISVCYGDNGDPIQDYKTPDQIVPGINNKLSIDALTGTLAWVSPQKQGDYNICILIEEYRKDTLSGNVVKVGEVLRDMQIKVAPCDNDPPEFAPLPDICVIAGDSLNQKVIAYDDGDVITLTAVGLPFDIKDSAIFDQGVINPDSVETNLFWQTTCEHIRLRPYQITFKAEDNRGLAELVNFATLNIRVIGPASDQYSATPAGNNIIVKWSPNPCSNAIGYNIYRKIDSLGYTPDECVTGVPASTGYQNIGFVSGYNSNTFLDDNDGNGLVHGHRYCYMITAIYTDKAESLPTPEVCAELKKDVPVITRVSVKITNQENGIDTISWAKPTELDDSVQFTPPYFYKVYRRTASEQEVLINSIGPFFNILDGDTLMVDSGLNTLQNQYQYRVELESSNGLVGSTQRATSIYLDILPQDEALHLTWDFNVPWTNNQFVVYKYNEDSLRFDMLDTVVNASYIDTSLKNGVSYCYKVQSIGRYSTDGFIDPIINFSQENCGIPKDTIAPCNPPNIFVEADCDLDNVYLDWENANLSCADDVAFYKVYFTSTLGGDYDEIYQTANAEELSLTLENLQSLAGCYAVTSTDSSGNESELGEKYCVDNCPIYTLPNIFTPGGDGFNDYFVPFPYKFVEDVDMKIFNRWGDLVYETTNPNIAWDGKNSATKRYVPSGVYFYICTVNEIRLTGIEPRVIKGNVTIINQNERTPASN
jgi:gliding motility-associated-like protein